MRPTLADYTHIQSGKVRDLYNIDDECLLMVASDRISAYDHVLETPIPDKGRVLTAMSVFFFSELGVPNHLAASADDERIPEEVLGRALIVKKLEMVPFECVARGYLTGSGLKDYAATGAVCGVKLPEGLGEASRLEEAIFTPATKADVGDHDENVTFDAVLSKLGTELAHRIRQETLDIYLRASTLTEARGIILADTKFEFGVDNANNLVLADEVLTPDSSRFWTVEDYAPGKSQPSFDKQFVRDWLTSSESGWDKDSDSPPPPLPDDIVDATRKRYIEAYERISGLSFDDWLGETSWAKA
ncbi:phosphoribosylaminoimidazolesuccinocarboxamide synthase [Hoyosella rhizosphaerae]|uniref:phosphoribosylaminoimidazolesuccinocarboxamide synthase n=1 Tax=Hoyosella rhizosphaerae TaxID=1755582 RepID=UPI0016673896|nr:phosphoribosylaminoimidazolesuccinocarboxamide synthase [Hoyosella rhizosphaerae]MBN4928277.1 phosphoribosylaminoimidazolesuccinocarboxamide synthase [Hoyosella rhizosphaerae]